MVAATVRLARWLDASSRRPRRLCALSRQKPQSPSLRSRLNDDAAKSPDTQAEPGAKSVFTRFPQLSVEQFCFVVI